MKNVKEEIKRDAITMIDDMEEFLNGSDSIPGSQNVIGFKHIFRGNIFFRVFSVLARAEAKMGNVDIANGVCCNQRITVQRVD